LKDIELKLISELMKNSRRSDRELARALGMSQPTITRTRLRLEKQGYIGEYTMLPNCQQLGLHICAINFVKLKEPLDSKKLDEARKFGLEFAGNHFSEVVVAERGRGLGYQAVLISFHKDYAAYVSFLDKLSKMHLIGDPDIESFLINLDDTTHYRRLTFSTLANHILALKENML
jgi:DNA-binding Lrp family transcriptional regulator